MKRGSRKEEKGAMKNEGGEKKENDDLLQA